jgi:1,2-diacylglycerol 3-alpha-glucosyltransferase
MTRVVMFTNTFEPMVGGLERSVATAHEDLQRAGHLCRVVTPCFDAARDSRDGVLRVPALRGLGKRKFSIPLPTSRRIRHWIEALQPQLLHAHQPFLLGDTAWQLARLRQIPLVFTHHTFYERYAHCLRMDAERARRMVMDMTTQFCNRSHMVIAPTPSVRRMLLERHVVAPIEVVPTGIDVQLYGSGCRARGRVALGLQIGDEVVGHIGRLSQEKNLEYLTHAALHVLQARPRSKLLLVGEGDRRDWARAQFAAAGMGERLIAPGTLQGVALADAYAALDVFIFGSQSDTQGLVLAEAMAAGVPVVALVAPGASDCIEHERSGWLLPATLGAREFAAAIEQLLAELNQRHWLSAGARHRARSYSRSACLERLLTVYEQTLQRCAEVGCSGRDWDALAPRWGITWKPIVEKLAVALRAAALRPSLESPPSGNSLSGL